jgi:class IV lanthipeptide synthase
MPETIAFPLREIVSREMARAGLADWWMQQDECWCHVIGPEPIDPFQSWTLHLSATSLSAPVVLHAAARVLVSNECQFKFARDLERGRDRAQAGPFITAYPTDEQEFHRLAAELCDATLGMLGPRLAADRPYRPGSIVHYRFG